mmetsp:Transcript_111225/g.321578  ORF Transcript_111225/g.321578 Transcript_111225/m.321578 type:complete len:213 (+) Transcript_111225:314-952(+)
MHCRAIQRWPLLVPRVPLVAPEPYARSDLKLLRERLLQTVLHPHDERLSLGEELLLALFCATISGPTRRRLWDHVSRRLHELGIGLIQVLITGALQVPQCPPGRIPVGRLARGARFAWKGVRDAEDPDFRERLARVPTPCVRPRRHRSELRQGGLAIILQLPLLAVHAHLGRRRTIAVIFRRQRLLLLHRRRIVPQLEVLHRDTAPTIDEQA